MSTYAQTLRRWSLYDCDGVVNSPGDDGLAELWCQGRRARHKPTKCLYGVAVKDLDRSWTAALRGRGGVRVARSRSWSPAYPASFARPLQRRARSPRSRYRAEAPSAAPTCSTVADKRATARDTPAATQSAYAGSVATADRDGRRGDPRCGPRSSSGPPRYRGAAEADRKQTALEAAPVVSADEPTTARSWE
ncbi:hypothetical protein PybrP1_001814 [[Pythium] brassicae (nom. inval.)]|nr:hypothetical protein PybrP1_001814 [[Pythium] brassicae (nom. inval.)]